ncbi:MAG: cytochrome c [Bacteroidota bacterium]
MYKALKDIPRILKYSLLLSFLSLLLIACKFNSEENHTAHLNPNDTGYEMQTELEESIQLGAEVYEDFCVTCHRPNGEGIPKSFPPLAGSDYLMNNREESIRAVKFGQQGEIVVNGITYNSVMAAQGLEDDEIANVMNYIMNSWGNKQEKMVRIEEIASITK